MRYYADLHIHSHFSRATSRDLDIPHIALWALKKGTTLVATGDIAHPGWLQEIERDLEPAEGDLFRLKPEVERAVFAQLPPILRRPIRFILGGEISNIYKKGGRTRKIHHVVFLPTLDAVRRFQARLERIGNIRADGRPILGLPSRDLLEILLETDPRGVLIPAHIWTPWFALLGSKSGYDSVEACFEDLTPHIFALETGLSSDPPMNWRVSALDRYTLVSNSDAHSPRKLGREANILDTEWSYDALFDALRTGDPARMLGTVEFFPEEGKYHYDGHRKCGVVWHPRETRAHQGLCPVCGKPVTVGVLHRVEDLADRPEGQPKPNARPYFSLIPLPEVLAELMGVRSPTSKRVQAEYERLLAALGPELDILLTVPLEDIARHGGPRLAEGIARMRRGEVHVQPGYDGEYGVIRVFVPARPDAPPAPASLFDALDATPSGPAAGQPTLPLDVPSAATRAEPPAAAREPAKTAPSAPEAAAGERAPSSGEAASPAPEAAAGERAPSPAEAATLAPEAAAGERAPSPAEAEASDALDALLAALNPEQREAVLTTDRPVLIVAGPGTGKTRTLTAWLAARVLARDAQPEELLAITFTNQAALEMHARLQQWLGPERARGITVATFHALAAMLLRRYGTALGLTPDFVIATEADALDILRQVAADRPARERRRLYEAIQRAKWDPDFPLPDEDRAVAEAYQQALRQAQALDYADLLVEALRLFDFPEVRAAIHQRWRWIAVDEYQDVNAAQYRLLKALAAGGARVLAIGDPDQAIYGFRGADSRYFHLFPQDFPAARVIRLTRNYRSAQALLDAALSVIASGGADAASRALFASFTEAVRLEIYVAPTDRAEAEHVVHRIEQLVGGTSYFSVDTGRVDGTEEGTFDFGDIAVLYRTRALLPPLLEAFQRSGIPYQTQGEDDWTRALRPVLALLQVVVNPRAWFAWLPLLAHARLQSLEDAIRRAAQHAGPNDRASVVWQQVLGAARLRPEARTRAEDLTRALQDVEALTRLGRLVEAVTRALEAVGPDDARDARAWLLRQAQAAHEAGLSLRAFLTRVALASEADAYDPRADRVALMTLHAAKGLEFPVVFIVGLEDGLLPYKREHEPWTEERLAEERRLLYVGMTRAQRRLFLSRAKRRRLYGRERRFPPSRFLDDIEDALKIVRESTYRRARKRPSGQQLSLF